MGILNLHKFLEKCVVRNHLSALRGSVLGVDAMCWMHRGSIASAWELLTGEDTDKFLRFFVKMLSLCNACGIKVIVVFDGASLPAKADEESARRLRRRENSEKAKAEILEKKHSNFSQVDPKLKSMIVQSVSISPEMITRCMSVLRRLGVEFVVAPFEADAQLAYMYTKGVVSGVISEDSDLLAFGCHRLISKLDTSGDFSDLRIDWAFKGSENAFGKPLDLGQIGKLEKWDQAKFVDLCILAGSDYKLGKIGGIGIKKAFTLLCKYGSMERVVSWFAESKKWTQATLNQYRSDLQYSRTAFSHHRVFDLQSAKCVLVSIKAEQETETDLAIDPATLNAVVGPPIPSDLCKAIMEGEIDAKTRIVREFLHKLPPGLLGKYNASLGNPSSGVEEDPIAAAGANYSAMEAQIVAEFERQKKNTQNLSDDAYLSSLERMILKKTSEFENIDDLLLLDEELQFIDEDEQLQSFVEEYSTPMRDVTFNEKNDHDTREEENRDENIIETCDTKKIKNPFLKNKSSAKKYRDDAFKFTVPTTSPVNPIMALFNKKQTVESSFVTHRDIVPKENNSFFTRRSG